MQRLSEDRRRAVVADVVQHMEEYHGDNLPQCCLYWAAAVVTRLKKEGVRAVLQAGSFSWPRIKPENDDGVCSTHFSYVFNRSDPFTKVRVAQGLLPEIHCWAAIPDTGEIIDLTTRFLPFLCESTGLEWTNERPPDYFWGTADELPDRVLYQPCMTAIALALQFLHRSRRVAV